MEKELTLDEMWKLIEQETSHSNHPLSFTTKMYMDRFGVSKTKAGNELNKLAERGLIVRIDRYYQTNRNGTNHAVKGWQWVEK